LFLFVRSSLGVDTLEAFVEYARKQPNPLNYGSAGNGTTPHLASELLKQATGMQATHAPYRGVAPAIQDLAAGQIDFAFGPATVFPMVQAGKLKVLAVASRQRAAVAPDIRTFSEAGIDGVFADSLFGVYAAAGDQSAVPGRRRRGATAERGRLRRACAGREEIVRPIDEVVGVEGTVEKSGVRLQCRRCQRELQSDTMVRKIYKASDRDGMYVTVSSTGTVTFRYDYRLNGRREKRRLTAAKTFGEMTGKRLAGEVRLASGVPDLRLISDAGGGI
jgi:hypothetical protein